MPTARIASRLAVGLAPLLIAAPALAQGVFSVNASSVPSAGTTYPVPVQILLIFTVLPLRLSVPLMGTSCICNAIVHSLVPTSPGSQALSLRHTLLLSKIEWIVLRVWIVHIV